LNPSYVLDSKACGRRGIGRDAEALGSHFEFLFMCMILGFEAVSLAFTSLNKLAYYYYYRYYYCYYY
jgi:hypothetical protein